MISSVLEPQKPVWYVYDQFSFDPLAEFKFPNKETNYNRAFGHPYAMEEFSGQSLHSYLYDEYGQMYDVNQRPRDASNFTDPHNAYTFSGKEFDSESSLSYFGARSYDPWSGTWTTQDIYRGQIENPASLHRYGFTENNPVNNVDKDGYFLEELAGYGAQIYTASVLNKPVDQALACFK